jgi:hypothetical protein
MRHYPLLFILMLSFVMPLQVAAEILLSSAPCPEEMTMQMNEAAASEAMPCCPDADDADKVNPCGTAKSCHLCKTPVPTFFSSLTSLSVHVKIPPLIVAVFNPASIWRPPNIS